MTRPNFLIIGAGKAGTTSLANYLNQHPQVFLAGFEPSLFALKGEPADFKGPTAHRDINRWSVSDWDTYLGLFDHAGISQAIGEKSPLYLIHPKAPERIQHHLPDVKLIAILRNPVERAYSAYTYLYGHGIEPIAEFADALEAEEDRIRKNWEWMFHYKTAGYYSRQLNRYFDRFDETQIHISLYEDFKNDTVGVVQDLFRFLEVDHRFVPDISIQLMATYKPRSMMLHRLIFSPKTFRARLRDVLKLLGLFNSINRLRDRLIMKNAGTFRPDMDDGVRQRLVNMYRSDIVKLQSLIDRDLSGWLE